MAYEEYKELLARSAEAEAGDELYITVLENKVVVNGVLEIEVMVPGNIMILEDKFKSSYDCKECEGRGKKKINCLKCEGKGSVVTGFNPDGSGDMLYEACPKCDGKGHKIIDCLACGGKGALIHTPDSSKHKPTSGRIVSMGPGCHIYELGDRVAYSQYIGHLLPFRGNNRLRAMSEKEPFCRLRELTSDNAKLEEVKFIEMDDAYQGLPGVA